MEGSYILLFVDDGCCSHFDDGCDEFISRYLIIDSDNDYVLKKSPCVFLNDDNSCYIYEYRPKACREYPHTNRKDFHKISQITMKNIEICPAAFNIVEKLKIALKRT